METTTTKERMPLDRLAANGHLPVSRSRRVRFVPPGSAAVYFLRPLTTLERLDIHARAVGDHGDLVTTAEVRDALREAAAAVWSAEEAGALGAILDDLEAHEKLPDPDADDHDRLTHLQDAVSKAERTLSRLYRPLAALLGANLQQRFAITAYTVRAVVVEWEGLPVPCRRQGGYVTEDALRCVPDADYGALAERAQTLRELTPDLEPDVASP